MNNYGNFLLTSSLACALAGLAVAMVNRSRIQKKYNVREKRNPGNEVTIPNGRGAVFNSNLANNQETDEKNVNSLAALLEDSSQSGELHENATQYAEASYEKKFQCTFCGQKLTRKDLLRRHELNHQNRKCGYCGRFFKEPIRLKNHLRTHTGEKPFQCSQCPAVFALKNNLKSHFIYKHTEDKPFECTYSGCGKYFKTDQVRKHHEKRHNQNAEHQCEICGMEFNVRAKLRMHYRKKHMDYNKRPHHCRFCDKKFVEKYQFREHERTHTGEKPLKCNQCSSSFAKKSSLREHKKLHSGEKKHICKICGKAFAQSAGYWSHMRNHP